MEHPGFDESQQLAAGNTWAMTRGLTTPEQGRAIVDEYKRRHEATGDAFPWWSLQPGYPDELGYWPGAPYCVQGGYANGGLLPYVGGGLCLAAFSCGRERYGVELLKQYTDMLKASGNRVYVWYWTNGEPGIRTANEVPRAGWGMSEWLMALIEGLAGVTPLTPRMRRIQIAPRWAAASQDEAYVSMRYAVNDSYIAYRLNIDRQARTVSVQFTGSGEAAEFHVLLPDGWSATRVLVGGAPVDWRQSAMAESGYVDLSVKIAGGTEVIVQCG